MAVYSTNHRAAGDNLQALSRAISSGGESYSSSSVQARGTGMSVNGDLSQGQRMAMASMVGGAAATARDLVGRSRSSSGIGDSAAKK